MFSGAEDNRNPHTNIASIHRQPLEHATPNISYTRLCKTSVHLSVKTDHNPSPCRACEFLPPFPYMK